MNAAQINNTTTANTAVTIKFADDATLTGTITNMYFNGTGTAYTTATDLAGLSFKWDGTLNGSSGGWKQQ